MEDSPVKVLILEDDPAQVRSIIEMLAESRKPVFSSQHLGKLEDGLALLRNRSFDVILVDLGLPDSRGLETALTVRNQARQTPVIVMAELDDEEAAQEALQFDIQDYLLKGEITGAVLQRSIRYAMQRQRDIEAQRQCEQNFSLFMHNLPVAAWMKDLLGRYVQGNDEHQRVFSMPFSDYSGKTDEDFLPLDTARRLRENDARVVSTGESVQTTEVLRLGDGTERHFVVTKFPVPGPDGKTAYVGGIAMDITERKQAEEALRKSEQKFAKIFHQVPALVGISSLPDGRYIDVNDTTLRSLGYERDELIGRSAIELGIWEELSDRDAVLQSLSEQGSVKNIEVRLRGKWGQRLICLFSAEYIEIEGIRYMLSLVRDITQKRQAEEQVERLNAQLVARTVELEEANRELESFNYAVAHDLRSPLNLIFGYCQIIMRASGDKLDEESRGYLQQSYDAVVRMSKLITALLDFSRMAHVEPRRDRVDVSAMAQAIAIELMRSEPERRVNFRISEGIIVNGDQELLRIVLANLLGNAWKYTARHEEAAIEFGVTEINGETACWVRDNGPGFDMADADELFKPFRRLAGAEKRSGFGIGLATVERIVRRHGGRVWAESEAGRGATFYFTLA